MLPFFANPRKIENVLFVIWSSLSNESLLAQLHDHLKKQIMLLSSAFINKKFKLFIYLAYCVSRITNSKESFFQAEVTVQSNIMNTVIQKKFEK